MTLQDLLVQLQRYNALREIEVVDAAGTVVAEQIDVADELSHPGKLALRIS
jgi:hypothetical protein